jgi:peptide/nickel transport system permease protein
VTPTGATGLAAGEVAVARMPRHDTLLRQAARRFARHRFAVAGVVILALMVVIAVVGPFLMRYGAADLDLRSIRQPPSAAHPFGTDTVGYDVLTRFLYGARTSLLVGFVAVTISVTIGTLAGVLGGFYGGVLDQVLGRVTDTLLSLPPLLLVAIFVAVVGPTVESVIIVIALLTWPRIARLVRGQVLVLREAEFVIAARVVGADDRSLIARHLLPNVLGPLSVAASYYMAQAILLEAALSFLGLGVRPPAPSWGNMVNLATNANTLQNLPWIWVPPALAIALVVLAINFIGDGLRDAVDPRATRRA